MERGGNFIDTANKYNDGTSEVLTGEFIAGDRHRFVLATKFALSMHQGDPNSGGNHRKNIVRSLEDSLKRLKTDYIDLYWLHQWDFTTPVEEIMRTLDDLVSAGKILYVGISDTPAWVASQANTLAALRGWTPFIGLQIEYSLIERTAERDLLPMARAFGLAVTPWGVVGGGVLTGKYHTAADPNAPPDSKRFVVNAARVNPRTLAIAAEVQAVATEINEANGTEINEAIGTGINEAQQDKTKREDIKRPRLTITPQDRQRDKHRARKRHTVPAEPGQRVNIVQALPYQLQSDPELNAAHDRLGHAGTDGAEQAEEW